MDQLRGLEEQLQDLIFSVNPATALPYANNAIQVADGQGNRRWQTVFDTISSQSAYEQAPLGYLPSTIFGISNDTSTLSSIVVTSYSSLSSLIALGGIPGSITGPELQSTTQWFQDPVRYISTGNLISSMTPFFNGTLSYMSNIQSSIIGLGTTGYVSSLSLQSTTTGVGGSIASSLIGAATFGYISSLTLLSTSHGIGHEIQSTVDGLGTINYVSSLSLQSTFRGLGTGGYVSSGTLTAATTSLTNTLGSSGYVSTAALLSTSHGILAAKQNIYIDQAGAVSIYGSDVYISTINAIIFLSSFVNSTLTYKGFNGNQQAVVSNNSNISFSTAELQLDTASTFIMANSRITGELYPTFLFDPITNGAVTSKAFTMKTYVQYSTKWLSSSVDSVVFGTSATAGFSNLFQQPFKLNLPGSDVVGHYHQPYVLYHTIEGGLSYALNVGFRNSNLYVQYGSTNSYFLSVQNLTF